MIQLEDILGFILYGLTAVFLVVGIIAMITLIVLMIIGTVKACSREKVVVKVVTDEPEEADEESDKGTPVEEAPAEAIAEANEESPAEETPAAEVAEEAAEEPAVV